MTDVFRAPPPCRAVVSDALSSALWACDAHAILQQADRRLGAVHGALMLGFSSCQRHERELFARISKRGAGMKEEVRRWRETHMPEPGHLVLGNREDVIFAEALGVQPSVVTFVSSKQDSPVSSKALASILACALSRLRTIRVLRFHSSLSEDMREAGGWGGKWSRGIAPTQEHTGHSACVAVSTPFVMDALVSAARAMGKGGGMSGGLTFGEAAIVYAATTPLLLRASEQHALESGGDTIYPGEEEGDDEWYEPFVRARLFRSREEAILRVRETARNIVRSLQNVRRVFNGVSCIPHTSEPPCPLEAGVVDTAFVCCDVMPRLVELHTAPVPGLFLYTEAARLPFVTVAADFCARTLRVALPTAHELEVTVPTRIGCAAAMEASLRLQTLVLEFRGAAAASFPFNGVNGGTASAGGLLFAVPSTVENIVLRFDHPVAPLTLLKNGLDTIRLRPGTHAVLSVCPMANAKGELGVFKEWAREKGIGVGASCPR